MLLYGANSPLNESSEELTMEQWCLYFHSYFSLFQDYSVNAEIDLELPPFIFGEQKNKKDDRLEREDTNNTDTGRGW